MFAGRPLGWIVNGFFTWLHKPTNDMIDKKGYISVLDDDDIWGPQYEGVDLSADEDLFGEENAGGEENALHDGDTNSGSGKVRLLARSCPSLSFITAALIVTAGEGQESGLRRRRANTEIVVTDASDDSGNCQSSTNAQ